MGNLNILDERTFQLIGAVLVLLVCILFIMMFMIMARLKKLRKNYNKMMNGTGVSDLEQLMIEVQQRLQRLENEGHQQSNVIKAIKQTLKQMKSKVGMIRYNAFQDHGSDLSFSLALVDESKDGVVLTGIHGREESYIYAKPLQNGNSKYTLSPEEKKAIQLAIDESDSEQKSQG